MGRAYVTAYDKFTFILLVVYAREILAKLNKSIRYLIYLKITYI